MNTIENGQQVAKIETDLSKVTFPTVDLNNFEITDLDDAEVMPIELTSIYWTPEQKGEEIRVLFQGIEYVEMPPMSDKDKENLNENGMVWIPCAKFVTNDGDGKAINISNSSKRLISTLQGSFIKPMTPLLITYLGKVKNKSNSFQSDSWSVKPLNVKTIPIAEKVREDIAKNGNNEEIGFTDEEEAVKPEVSPSGINTVIPTAQTATTAASQRRRFN